MSTQVVAEISPVPARYRGKALTRTTKLIENGLFLFQLVLFAGGALVPALLGGLAAMRQLFPNNQFLSFSPVLLGLGLSAGLMWFLFGLMLRQPWSAAYMFNKTRTEFLRRDDVIVDPNNPDAIFAEIIPRRNWGQISLQNAEDQGFLLVDMERGQLLFEGDNKRYRVPAQALISCEMELMNESAAEDPHGVPVGLVVVTLRDSLGEREVPLRPVRTVAGASLGGNYVERANELQRRILDLPQVEPIQTQARTA